MNQLVQKQSCTQRRSYLRFLSAACLLALSGWASSYRGVSQDVQINSYPYNARIYVDGQSVGTTPLDLKLFSKTNYEVKFEKAGYKPFVEYIGPALDLKDNPIIKLGPLDEAGFYNRLGPNPMEVELEHVLVPEIAGPDILSELLVKTEQLDRLLNSGKISLEEHSFVAQQLIDFYKDESARRGTPVASMTPVGPVAPSVTKPTAFPATPKATDPTAPMSIPGELNELDNLDLDAVTLPPSAFPATPTAPTLDFVPDLSDLDNLTLPTTPGNVPIPVAEPLAPPPPALSPETIPPTATPFPGTLIPAVPTTSTPPTPSAPSKPAPFNPLNFGSPTPANQ